MIGATMSRAPAARRSWRRWTPALAGFGLVALAATACGGAGATAAPPTASSNSLPAPASSQATFPGVVGTAAAVSASSLEVQNPNSGQVTVTYTKATAITDEVAATSRDITVGSCVTVAGQPPAGGTASGSAARSVTATTVTVSTPVNGNCGGPGGFGGPRGSFSPNPSFSARPRPSGSRGAFGNGAFGGANGKVTSLSASGFVVRGRGPGDRAGASASPSASPAARGDITVSVTTTAATKYLKVITAGRSAFKVGECITAVGQANSIGAVAARTIRISQPGPNGCVTGLGRRGASGRGPSGAASNA